MLPMHSFMLSLTLFLCPDPSACRLIHRVLRCFHLLRPFCFLAVTQQPAKHTHHCHSHLHLHAHLPFSMATAILCWLDACVEYFWTVILKVVGESMLASSWFLLSRGLISHQQPSTIKKILDQGKKSGKLKKGIILHRIVFLVCFKPGVLFSNECNLPPKDLRHQTLSFYSLPKLRAQNSLTLSPAFASREPATTSSTYLIFEFVSRGSCP